MQLVDPLVLTLVYIFNQPFEYSFYSWSSLNIIAIVQSSSHVALSVTITEGVVIFGEDILS